jgi:hypothetical protein
MSGEICLLLFRKWINRLGKLKLQESLRESLLRMPELGSHIKFYSYPCKLLIFSLVKWVDRGLIRRMFFKPLKAVALVACLVNVAGISSSPAELPIMQDKEWLGYFVGAVSKERQFSIDATGKMVVKVFGKKGTLLPEKIALRIDYAIEETLPNGKITTKVVIPDSLESSQPATLKPKDLVIRGKVAGDATFELFVSEERGAISLGGRVVNPGQLTKDSLKLKFYVRFPNAYPSDNPGADKDKLKAFATKTSRDQLQLIFTDGKRSKHEGTKEIDANSAETNGPGISAVQMDFAAYEGHKLALTASPNSSMKLSNVAGKLLYSGFTAAWVADSAKDPDAKARLSIGMK